MLFVVAVIALILLMCFWLFDMNTSITTRIRAQNGADSAAVGAAQWQAKSLNAIGEINLIKGINTLLEDVPPGDEVQARLVPGDPIASYFAIQECLDELQARLTFVGPVIALEAAQAAARSGGVPENEPFTQDLRDQADFVEQYYGSVYSASGWNSPDWAQRYSRMLRFVADRGVAVASKNTVFYWGQTVRGSPQAERYLFNETFYQAIELKDWCYLKELLIGTNPYTGWEYWGQISVVPREVFGSEYFNLGVKSTHASTLENSTMVNYFTSELNKRNLQVYEDWPPPIKWATYIQGSDAAEWGPWKKMKGLIDSRSLIADSIVPAFHYQGADAKVFVSIPMEPWLPLKDRSAGSSEWIVSEHAQQKFEKSIDRFSKLHLRIQATASAKPFGKLPNVDTPAYVYEVVLPIYEEVRLVPNKAVIGTQSEDRKWMIHLIKHLPEYVVSGPDVLPGDDFWDEQLIKWEDPAFRQEGIDWLNQPTYWGGSPCDPPPREPIEIVPGPGGGSRGGSWGGGSGGSPSGAGGF